ncbi:MAG: serine/threonine protein kinase [Deltaproteobacteria bacterium]|nr:serine/threonine protein kinase [Deltaproteobacteria bacterium]
MSAIDRYEVRNVLGEGATSKVYLAHDPKMDREVAVKLLASNAPFEVRERFRLEAKAIATLKHPNIVELYDYSGPDAQDLFLVMEYIPGRSLYVVTREHGPMSEATALCVGHELALALDHAHAHHIVHRDLKPENVLLSSGRIVLTDFGAVKAVALDNPLGVSSVHTRTKMVGTPGFMPPEQFDGRGIDQRSDIFSLGATLYNLTTSRIPYEGGSVEQTYKNLKSGRYVDPREHHPLLSPDFCRLLAGALAPNPKSRYKSAAQFKEQILGLIGSHGVTEIRSELSRYEGSPAIVAVEQRERSLGVLLRDLKVALKDRDVEQARALIDRIQTIAPLDERVQQVSEGVMRPVAQAASARGARWAWLGMGFVAGAVAGGLAVWLAG